MSSTTTTLSSLRRSSRLLKNPFQLPLSSGGRRESAAIEVGGDSNTSSLASIATTETRTIKRTSVGRVVRAIIVSGAGLARSTQGADCYHIACSDEAETALLTAEVISTIVAKCAACWDGWGLDQVLADVRVNCLRRRIYSRCL